MNFPDLSFNPAARIEGRHIGAENQPLLIIDNVLRHPQQMVDYAADHGQFAAPPEGSYYPGRNGVLPPDYGPSLVTALRPLLARGFGIPASQRLSYEGFFGLTTFAAETLDPLQTIPHFDSTNPYRLAMVHYFCAAPFQGTAFFRHEPTGYEFIDSARLEDYRTHVDAELKQETRRTYADEATPRYRRTDYVEAVFDRLAVYRTTILHAGMMGGAVLTNDPKTGRLTANSFIEIHRA